MPPDKTKKLDLPVLPCLWCDFQHPIEFDLGNDYLASHTET